MLGRAFAILAAFSPAAPSLTLSPRSAAERAADRDRPPPRSASWSARRASSAQLDGSYAIGRRLWEVGSLAPARGGLRELALPFMEDLYEATHANVQLAVREGLEALFVEKISGRESVEILTRVGGRLPLHATGVGKVLLAYAPPEVHRRRHRAGPRAAHAEHDRRTPTSCGPLPGARSAGTGSRRRARR